MRSGDQVCRIGNAADPSVTLRTAKPACSKPYSSSSRRARSSSTTSTRAGSPLGPILRLTPGLKTHPFVTIGPSMSGKERPFRRFFVTLCAILAAAGCGGRPAARPSPVPLVDTAVASFGSIEPARATRGRRRALSERRYPEHAGRARRHRLRARGRHGSRRSAARAAGHLRSPSAAAVRSRDREQQSREYGTHGLSGVAEHRAGSRHRAHRRGRG